VIAAPTTTDAAARDIVVETDSVRAVFTTQGAALKSWKLLRYRGDDGQPLDLVPSELPTGQFARPFTIATDDDGLTKTLAAAVYQVNVDGLKLGPETGTLTFDYRDASGLVVRKTFTFQADRQPYALSTEFSAERGGTPLPITVAFGPAVGPGYSASGTRWPNQAIYFQDGSVNRVSAAAVQAQPRYEGAIRYAGVEDHYFLASALTTTGVSRVVYSAVTLPVPQAPEGQTRSFISFAIRPAPSETPRTVSLRYFIGPKDFDQLRAADVQLTRAIDFGWFAKIVVPMLQALKWINRFVGNYGWSIILLTVFINVLIFPLRHRSMVSMKKMQALQPQVKAIQERYAKFKVTDPERQKMNSEMMALYKQKGVNPASGCIPMLLTFPILIAFYNLLNSAIELRGAPFVGWIHDLASKDPTYVWPILMGATMFWQQKMTPSTADPVQQKIFLLMPVVFTVMFLGMPSGLVIYWLTSNILTIGQQYLTNHLIGNATPNASPRKA
jgi:YidC/Oxa1 family membrane protein insertase